MVRTCAQVTTLTAIGRGWGHLWSTGPECLCACLSSHSLLGVTTLSPCEVMVSCLFCGDTRTLELVPGNLLCCFPGLQEYVEAVSFQHFIRTRSLISMEEINRQLTFTTDDSGKESKAVRIGNPVSVLPWFIQQHNGWRRLCLPEAGFVGPQGS